MKKIISLFLSLVMLLGTIPVYATNIGTAGSTGTTPVELTTEALTFSVTVPTSLPINVDNQGVVTVSNDVNIVNNGAGPVKVEGVKVEAKSPWVLATYNDLSAEKVGTKKFGISIQGAGALANGSCTASFDSISAGGSIDLTYDAYVAPQSVAVSNQNIANVVFTVGWDDGYTDVILTRDHVKTLYLLHGDIEIPRTFQNTDGTWYKVVGIDDTAFYQYDITSVIIPDSVTSIGARAFESCLSLTSIIIPNKVTSIRTRTFSNCTKLTSITLPDNLTSIDEYAFENCKSLTSITIPENVTSIGKYAFLYNKLTSITFKGTKAQWNNIPVTNHGLAGKTIHCRDGNLVSN